LSLEEAAKKTRIRRSTLLAWETIKGAPTPRQLEKLADTYKRPVATFFLSSPPEDPPLPTDFRVLPQDQSDHLSPQTRFAIRRARRLQAIYEELSDGSDFTDSELPAASTTHDPDAVGATARQWLGISVEAQTSWGAVSPAFRNWRRAIESRGVLTFQFSMPLEDVRGFSMSSRPTIVINSRDAVSAREFTMFHELAHLMLRQPGICQPDETDQSGSSSTAAEVFCNAVAASALMPMDALLNSDEVANYRSRRTSLQDTVTYLVARFSVSRYVVLRRLVSAGLVPNRDYRRITDDWDAEGRSDVRRRSKYGPPPHVKTLSELGPRFVSYRQKLWMREKGDVPFWGS
jgi:Zn-dependent peptidase ImmA (M78 family)